MMDLPWALPPIRNAELIQMRRAGRCCPELVPVNANGRPWKQWISILRMRQDGMPVLGFTHAVEEIAGLETDLMSQHLGLTEMMMHQQAAVRAVVVQLAQQILDLPAGDGDAQMIAGD